jgi:hypothetical protein
MKDRANLTGIMPGLAAMLIAVPVTGAFAATTTYYGTADGNGGITATTLNTGATVINSAANSGDTSTYSYAYKMISRTVTRQIVIDSLSQSSGTVTDTATNTQYTVGVIRDATKEFLYKALQDSVADPDFDAMPSLIKTYKIVYVSSDWNGIAVDAAGAGAGVVDAQASIAAGLDCYLQDADGDGTPDGTSVYGSKGTVVYDITEYVKTDLALGWSTSGNTLLVANGSDLFGKTGASTTIGTDSSVTGNVATLDGTPTYYSSANPAGTAAYANICQSEWFEYDPLTIGATSGINNGVVVQNGGALYSNYSYSDSTSATTTLIEGGSTKTSALTDAKGANYITVTGAATLTKDDKTTETVSSLFDFQGNLTIGDKGSGNYMEIADGAKLTGSGYRIQTENEYEAGNDVPISSAASAVSSATDITPQAHTSGIAETVYTYENVNKLIVGNSGSNNTLAVSESTVDLDGFAVIVGNSTSNSGNKIEIGLDADTAPSTVTLGGTYLTRTWQSASDASTTTSSSLLIGYKTSCDNSVSLNKGSTLDIAGDVNIGGVDSSDWWSGSGNQLNVNASKLNIGGDVIIGIMGNGNSMSITDSYDNVSSSVYHSAEITGSVVLGIYSNNQSGKGYGDEPNYMTITGSDVYIDGTSSYISILPTATNYWMNSGAYGASLIVGAGADGAGFLKGYGCEATIEDGSYVELAGNLIVGEYAIMNEAVIDNSEVIASDVYVGIGTTTSLEYGCDNLLAIKNGSELYATGNINVGYYGGATSSTAALDGSEVTYDGNKLEVTNSWVSSASIVVGNGLASSRYVDNLAYGSNNKVTVDGGSSGIDTSDFILGLYGSDNSMTISNGAWVVAYNSIVIGKEGEGFGTILKPINRFSSGNNVEISGEGTYNDTQYDSTLYVDKNASQLDWSDLDSIDWDSLTIDGLNALYIGEKGQESKLSVGASGVVASETDVYIGSGDPDDAEAGSSNTVVINGKEAQFLVEGTIVIGVNGSYNEVTVKNGGLLAARNLVISANDSLAKDNYLNIAANGFVAIYGKVLEDTMDETIEKMKKYEEDEVIRVWDAVSDKYVSAKGKLTYHYCASDDEAEAITGYEGLAGYTIVYGGDEAGVDVSWADANSGGNGDGWYCSSFLGWFYTDSADGNWAYSSTYGWLYICDGAVSTSVYIYDQTTDSWLWTSKSMSSNGYQFFYDLVNGQWLYLDGASGSWYYWSDTTGWTVK